MTGVVQEAFRVLRSTGAKLEPGLSDDELLLVQDKWGFRFCPDHAEFLRLGLPVGHGWVDWRAAPDRAVHARLDAPILGLVFDVEYNEFWPLSWGARPRWTAEARAIARERLSAWPRLVPLYRHRYLPSGAFPSPAPVLSVMQSDIVFCGLDLREWVHREFFGVPLPAHEERPCVGPWSSLAEGVRDRDL